MSSIRQRALRYFWDPEPRNEDPSSPICCLGAHYDATLPPPSPTQPARSSPPPSDGPLATVFSTNPDAASTWPPAFLDDFESRIWMTYRTDFAPIPRSPSTRALSGPAAALQYAGKLLKGQAGEGFNSDVGWGCMIRSAQSVLANALSTLHLGRDWRIDRGEMDMRHVEILSWFADDPHAPFSIHKFVKHGEISCAKAPGEWFGPAAASRCIQLVSQDYEPANLRVSVTGDQDGVYEDQVLALSGEGPMKPTLLLIGKRLGHDNVNPLYYRSLKALLELPQSVGIAGGRPSSSHYFCASQGDYLFYLDPHHPRPALPLHQELHSYTLAEVDTYHTRRLRRMHLLEMDPSMLIAFLVKDADDWADWKNRIAEIGKLIPAVIHIFDTAPPTSPKHDGDIEDFEEDEDPESLSANDPETDPLAGDEPEAIDKSTLSEDTTTTKDTSFHDIGGSLVSEDDDDGVLVPQ